MYKIFVIILFILISIPKVIYANTEKEFVFMNQDIVEVQIVEDRLYTVYSNCNLVVTDSLMKKIFLEVKLGEILNKENKTNEDELYEEIECNRNNILGNANILYFSYGNTIYKIDLVLAKIIWTQKIISGILNDIAENKEYLFIQDMKSNLVIISKSSGQIITYQNNKRNIRTSPNSNIHLQGNYVIFLGQELIVLNANNFFNVEWKFGNLDLANIAFDGQVFVLNEEKLVLLYDSQYIIFDISTGNQIDSGKTEDRSVLSVNQEQSVSFIHNNRYFIYDGKKIYSVVNSIIDRNVDLSIELLNKKLSLNVMNSSHRFSNNLQILFGNEYRYYLLNSQILKYPLK